MALDDRPSDSDRPAGNDVTSLAELLPPLDSAGPRGRLLERIAVALNSTLDLGDVLRLLAEAGLDATGASGTAVLLLQGRRLIPASVVRVIPDDTLHERFHGLEPIELDEFRWSLLQAGRAIAFEDARGSDLVPPELVDRFTLRGFALVPLMAAGEPCGVMCVDWDEVRAFGPNDLAILEAFGSYAGMAVRNARLYETMRRRAGLQHALTQSAAALASPLEPEVMAGRLADAYRELLGARLCAVALFAPERDHISSLATRGVPDLPTELRLSDVPRRIFGRIAKHWMTVKEPVQLGDDPWLGEEMGGHAAGASWYLFLPLVVGGHAAGTVILGFGPHDVLDDEERSAADALADIAAAALERHELVHRLDRQLDRLNALYDTSAALNSSVALRPVLDVVCSAFEELLGTSHCSVNLIGEPDPDLLRTLAHSGVAWFAGRPESVGAVSRAEVARLREQWIRRPEPAVYVDIGRQLAVEPFLVPATVRSAVLFPLAHAGGVFGVIVAGFRDGGVVGPDDLEAGRALAGLAATAIDRAGLSEALSLRLQQVETLYRLSDVVAGTSDLDAAMRELNRLFEPELAVTFGSVAIANRDLRDAMSARAPDAEEMEAIRSWRAVLGKGANPPRVRAAASGLLVPVVHRSRVYGALRVAPRGRSPESATEELLIAIGAGCAEIVLKAALHRDLADRQRELTIAVERERIARDLHDSVGQVLTGMGMLLTQCLFDAPDEAWRRRLEDLAAMAGQGAREVRDSVNSLLFLQSRRVGLVASLRELAAKVEAMTGVQVRVEVIGAEAEVPVAKEDALFRVAHEALMNIERHAHASTADLQLRYEAHEVTLVVRDDGIGMGSVPDDGRRHFGLAGIEGRLEEVGGDLWFSSPASSGAVVHARVPIKVRRGRG